MYWKEIISYLLAFIIGVTLIVYVLDFGSWITGNRQIVHSYYHYWPNLLLDLGFIAAYLLIAIAIIKYFKIKENITKFGIVIITTITITSLFCLYFITRPMTTAFFSKWFHTVGYSSAIYDAVLIGFVYLLAVRIYELIQ